MEIKKEYIRNIVWVDYYNKDKDKKIIINVNSHGGNNNTNSLKINNVIILIFCRL